MSILIRGMEMPKSCIFCELYEADLYWCRAAKKEYYETIENKAHPDWCPLVSVPPHGRLIDADALVKDLKRQLEEVFKIDAVSPDDFWIKRDKAYNERLWKTWCESFFEYLKARETIIEAEGRE